MPTLTQGADATMPKGSSSSQLVSAHDDASKRDRRFVDLVCFSHLRWDFVFQRPQHLLTRAAQSGRVFYWEEPLFEAVLSPLLRERAVSGGVIVVQPVLPHGTVLPHGMAEADAALRALLDAFVADKQLSDYVVWYYTPMALSFTEQMQPAAVVYDCMDELAAFRGAPPELLEREDALLQRADVVFVGGASLFESKQSRHGNIHLFPSSVDVPHFAKAREEQDEPEDQSAIPHPRVGFYGVLDERLDMELLRAVAELRPEMQFVILGPIAKISDDDLPKRLNLHYLGRKSYDELPRYLAGWDAAMLPFARNDATRFISPTKTPEYLAAWRPVVSTRIRDVASPYGDAGLVAIADNPDEFAQALDAAVSPPPAAWKAEVDRMLARGSWNKTWNDMCRQIVAVMTGVKTS